MFFGRSKVYPSVTMHRENNLIIVLVAFNTVNELWPALITDCMYFSSDKKERFINCSYLISAPCMHASVRFSLILESTQNFSSVIAVMK